MGIACQKGALPIYFNYFLVQAYVLCHNFILLYLKKSHHYQETTNKEKNKNKLKNVKWREETLRPMCNETRQWMDTVVLGGLMYQVILW